VVIAAEQQASRLVVPSSQRTPATRWGSHKDIAAKALKKLADPNAPASLTRLEQAVKCAHSAYDKAETLAREQQRAERQPVEAEPNDAAVDDPDDNLEAAAWPASPAGGPTRRPIVARPGGRAGGRGIGPPAGRAPSPGRSSRWPAALTASRSPTRSARRAARLTANASSRPPARGRRGRRRRWIKVRASNGLSRYSLRNQWLIAIECHARGITPTYVAGFRAFLKLNRCVRRALDAAARQDCGSAEMSTCGACSGACWTSAAARNR